VVRNSREPILKEAGYTYNFDRMAYFNRAAKKVFSVEWLEDHPEGDLLRALAESNESGHWRLYADVRPSQRVIDAFLAEIDAR
jgi:hypothetical protein